LLDIYYLEGGGAENGFGREGGFFFSQNPSPLGQKKKSLVSGPPLAEKMVRASDIFFYFVIFFC